MGVTLLFFAGLKDYFPPEVAIDFPDGSTLSEVLQRLTRDKPDAAGLLNASRFAIGDRIVPLDASISRGDRIAVLPPPSGG